MEGRPPITHSKLRITINILYAILLIISIVVSFISLKYFFAPYIWIALSWFIVFLYGTIFSTKTITKALCLYLAVISLTFGIYEAYLWIYIDIKPIKIQDHIQGVLQKKNDLLGYAPIKNSKVLRSRFYGNEPIYDVIYTIDSDGLRKPPPYKGGNITGCVLFFGDSFTFGEAVNDEETIPYWTGIKTHGQYRIYNFGFGGYGPHQMLSALEHGLVETIIKCNPKYAIYQAIDAHIIRAAGLSFWDRHGPKYILRKNGEIIYNGHFDDEKLAILKKNVILQLRKSLIFSKVLDRYFNRDNINLFIEMVSASRRIMETRYPESEFHVIIWNNKESELSKKLEQKGMRVHYIRNILIDYPEKRSKYMFKHDGHPNSLANKMIAEYVVNKIIGK